MFFDELCIYNRTDDSMKRKEEPTNNTGKQTTQFPLTVDILRVLCTFLNAQDILHFAIACKIFNEAINPSFTYYTPVMTKINTKNLANSNKHEWNHLNYAEPLPTFFYSVKKDLLEDKKLQKYNLTGCYEIRLSHKELYGRLACSGVKPTSPTKCFTLSKKLSPEKISSFFDLKSETTHENPFYLKIKPTSPKP